jgi:hypothetical protein
MNNDGILRGNNVGTYGRGLTYPLAGPRSTSLALGGAWALEAYLMITQPGREITRGEVHVGTRRVSRTPGSRTSAAPPFGEWSGGSRAERMTATYWRLTGLALRLTFGARCMATDLTTLAPGGNCAPTATRLPTGNEGHWDECRQFRAPIATVGR